MAAPEKNQPANGPGSHCGKLAYLALLLAVAVLAFTGIGTFVSGCAPMTHWVLMAHVAVAPVFALALAVLALTWSARNLFGDASAQTSAPARAFFWLILLGGLVVILSGVTPMLPLFGTHGQHLLYLTHRYAAIVLFVVIVLHWAAGKKKS